MKICGIEYTGNLKWLDESILFVTKHGSHAYGLNVESSDLDIKGVCVPPEDYYVGLSRFEQVELRDEQANVEGVVYELRKFLMLASQCNPNIVELLWTDDSDLLRTSKSGDILRSNRRLFLSKQAINTYGGYAHAQLSRIKLHNRYVTTDIATLSPPERKRYEEWKKNRNPKRAALEAAHGYDTKHAMHLVRLLKTCKELLKTCELRVKRDDRQELLAIRGGAWSYDRLLAWADEAFVEINEISGKSLLPARCDAVKVNDLCKEIVHRRLSL